MTTNLVFTVPRAAIINANWARAAHWAQVAKRTKILRTITGLKFRGVVPFERRVHVLVTYTYPDRRWPRDDANLAPTTKALIDGLTDAGLWPDDSHESVDGPDTRIDRTPDPHLPDTQVRVAIEIKEVP